MLSGESPTAVSNNLHATRETGEPNHAGAGQVVQTFFVAAAAPSSTGSVTPAFYGQAEAAGFVGLPLTYFLSASGAASYTATGLPTALTLNPATGVVSGTPTQAGTTLVTVYASNAAGTTPAALTLQVVAPDFSLPRLTAQPSGGITVENAAFTLASAAVGAPAPVFQWWHNGALLSGASGPTLSFDAVQPTDSGNYTVTAANAAGSVTSNSATLLVQTSYGDWQADHFTSQEIAAGLAAGTYSFSGDGVANLLKYALDLDPLSSTVGALTTSSRAAGGALQIQFDREAGKTDISYLVEVSTDLHNWAVIAQSVAGDPMTGLNGGTVVETAVAGSTQALVTVEAAPPTDSNAQFLRLRITRP